MSFNSNPFLERMSERTTSDLDFARLFSPKILEKISGAAFSGGLHIFRSSPGAGKTTLLRSLTPPAIKSFWSARGTPELGDAFKQLSEIGVLNEGSRDVFLGVMISCASGYADIPPGANINQASLFRALLNCRIVLRTIRGLESLLNLSSDEQLELVSLRYDESASDLKGIPKLECAKQLVAWAESCEQKVYAELDSLSGGERSDMPSHHAFEGVLWLQSVDFLYKNRVVAENKILMIDDVHKLKKSQRLLLIDEISIMRPKVSVWLAERMVALGDGIFSQGVREGREIHEYVLEDLWSGQKSQFSAFAKSILDRRMLIQESVASKSFSQCLVSEIVKDDLRCDIDEAITNCINGLRKFKDNIRYIEWLDKAEKVSENKSVESLFELIAISILVARKEAGRQMSLGMTIPVEEIGERDGSGVHGAAEIFAHEKMKVPYYYGIDRLITMSSYNVEELLSLSASLYLGMKNKQLIQRSGPALTPEEQERILVECAKKKRDFIPRNHTEGTKARRLLDSIGKFCKERTFLSNAPYAPGVTGVRVSCSEIDSMLDVGHSRSSFDGELSRVLSECAAENLLMTRDSSESSGRRQGKIFYLNRTLCSYYGLPLQQGGWQEVSKKQLVLWMEKGFESSKSINLEIGA